MLVSHFLCIMYFQSHVEYLFPSFAKHWLNAVQRDRSSMISVQKALTAKEGSSRARWKEMKRKGQEITKRERKKHSMENVRFTPKCIEGRIIQRLSAKRGQSA